ncbi:MAG: hypothetical protein WC655_09590 [Candidatus Hydrogenedentales bacterium]|jgi:hypothetical protein
MATESRIAPCTRIDREHPLIILQTSNRFPDSDEQFGMDGNRMEAATAHGKEAVRVWRDAIPDELRPFCQLQMEVRTHDHVNRYDAFRRIFAELEEAGAPANIQFADPHDPFVFDPDYVEKLTQEFSCIKSYTITEMRWEHYRTFNVPRYALPPETRYAIDVIKMAGRYGKHISMSFQDLKWMHIGADALHEPLVETIMDYSAYVLAVNEHIGPRHLQRQTSVWGFWIADMVKNWGVEPQSWWFENGRMLSPGLFGQRMADDPRQMPPLLYRAMILQGALLGATVYQFEPYWDLFDYDNSHCWRDVICPTLLEVVNDRLISSREQVMEKTKVVFQYKPAKDINEFHESLRDIDWIGDEGLFCRAAYGLWEKYLQHELIPNRSQNFFIPLLPPKTPAKALEHFKQVVTPGTCTSVEAYEELLARHYTQGDGEGTASIMTINGHTYVMQTHENLYERQTYAIDVPKAVRQISTKASAKGLDLSWPSVDSATEYRVYRVEGAIRGAMGLSKHLIGVANSSSFTLDKNALTAGSSFTVTAITNAKERREGTVNYLDYFVFSLEESLPAEVVTLAANGAASVAATVEPEDTRPASQIVYPTFEGAEGPNKLVAQQIVTRIDEFKKAYDARDWRRLTDLYSCRYQDPNGFHREYVGRAWKWWFFRNNNTTFLRQIRTWDFSEYKETGVVRVRMFALCRACRYDDAPFGYWTDGTVRVPRHADEIVTFTWHQEEDQAWRLIHTDPALPNFEEMLWNSRGEDLTGVKLVPGVDS